MRSSRASLPPITTDRYRHGPELGRGGMGRVVEAFDTQLGRTVALKEVLPKGEGVARRFIREVEITARLEHASIVPLYDSGTSADGRPFYVMRRVTGRPLDEQIKRTQGLGERLTLLPAVLAAIDAVAHAHKRGIIHRDIKPANILVGELGETVVIDWGLAKVIGEDDDEVDGASETLAADSLQTQIGAVFGTPGFMAPEQARGEPLSPRSDVYALGATLYQLLSGSPPHAGDSATIVLGRTLKHDVVPLARSAPGAPPELVAIVDKALAFEADARYPSASALGEDVRRFLAGQLVAAHRYTPRQRVTRFAKRHRASLAIAALATAALAVLAAFSVHQIVQERDAATEARHQALAEKRAAEAAAVSLADRNDALLLIQARSLLDSNPTESIAVLKQLRADSSRLPEARAIAQAAVTRGVWTAIQSTDVLTTFVQLSLDGKLLVQVTRDMIVRVWDLEGKRLVIARPYPTFVYVSWLTENRLVVYGKEMAPEILDPAANRATGLGIGPAIDVEVSETGDRMLVSDAQGVAWFDFAAGTSSPLWKGRVERMAIAPDGQWAVVADDKTAIAFDRDGNELVRVAGDIQRVQASRYRTFAVVTSTTVTECTLDPKPVCNPLAFPVTPRPMILDLQYRARELALYSAGADVFGWDGYSMQIRAHINQYSPRFAEVRGDVLLVPTHTGRIHVIGPDLVTSIVLPVPVMHARVVARAAHSRIAVVGDGQILVLDLAQMLPRVLPDTAGAHAQFLDDDTIVAWRTNGTLEWKRINLASGYRDSLSINDQGMADVLDTRNGRGLITGDGGPNVDLVMMDLGQKLVKLARVAAPWGILIDGNAVIYGGSALQPDGSFKADGRVLARVNSGAEKEVVKLDGGVARSVRRGFLQYAVISTRGELVRGNLGDGLIERVQVDLGTTVSLASDPVGRILIGNDDRLLVWDQTVVEIARFDRVIRQIGTGEGGRILVTLMNHDVMEIMPEPGAKPTRLVAGEQEIAIISGDGKMIAAPANGQQMSLLELGAGASARWTLPFTYRPSAGFALSPSSRRLVQSSFTGFMVWNLPTASQDLPAWLDEQTNATKNGDEVLAWPWQVRR